MRIELDCARMLDRKQTHDYLKAQFGFPNYYGKNLDALYDLLSSADEDYEISVVNREVIEENLGGYGSALLAAIEEASEDNPRVTLVFCL